MVYGTGCIDSSGRVAGPAVTSALVWRGGDRLTFTADAGVMVARHDSDSRNWPRVAKIHPENKDMSPSPRRRPGST